VDAADHSAVAIGQADFSIARDELETARLEAAR